MNSYHRSQAEDELIRQGQERARQEREWTQRVNAEIDRSRPPTVLLVASFVVWQAFTRVAGGGLFAAISVFAGSYALDALGTPFAALSPLQLIGGLVSGCIALSSGLGVG